MAGASNKLLYFVKFFKKQSGTAVHQVHTNGATEFTNACELLKNQGVEVSLTTSSSPQSNGLAERMHSNILSLV